MPELSATWKKESGVNILEHITVNGDRKLREVSDQAYQRGFNKGRREGREESTHEFQKVIEEQESFHRKQLADTLQQGRREGYSSRGKDEVAARWHGTPVTAWSCALCDNNQIELTLTGNMLDYDDADQIAAALIYHLNVIRAREAHDQKEERND